MKKSNILTLFLSFILGCSTAIDGGINDGGTEDSSSSSSSGGIDAGIQAPASGSWDLFVPESDPLIYMGGSIMTSPITINYIWYGEWNDVKYTAPILEDMAKNLTNNPWYKINDSYYETLIYPPQESIIHNIYVSPQVNFGNSVYVGSKYGLVLSYDDITSIVSDTLNSGSLPIDTNAQYFVLTSKEVSIVDKNTYLGSCTNFCGWHMNYSFNGTDIKYACIIDTMACPSVCSLKPVYETNGFLSSPNNDWSADGMASIILHESSEMATDPHPFTDVAWQNIYHYENADMCAWTFGELYISQNNSVANVKIGNRDFLIQQNWSLATNSCSLK